MDFRYLVASQQSGSGAAAGLDVTAPTITSSNAVNVAENSALSHTLTANEAVTYSLVGGADIALFTLLVDNLSMTAKDFENPIDSGANNTYVVIVRATDTALNFTDQTFTATVTDVVELNPIVADQTMPGFGALTAAGHGGWTPVNSGAAITSATIDSGDASNHFDIASDGELIPTATGDTANLNLGPYALVCTFNSASGSDTATITVPTSGTDADGNDLALARSVAPSTNEAEFEAATEHASLARGEFILLRSGAYNAAQADRRTTRTGAVGAGTGGYVTIAPHAGASPIIHRWSVFGTTIAANWFHFRGLAFEGYNDGTLPETGVGLLSFINSVTDCKVSGSSFTFPTTLETQAAGLTNGIQTTGATGARIEVSGNTFTNCYGAATMTGVDLTVQDNDIVTFFNDVFKFSSPASRLQCKSNRMRNAKTPYDAYTITNITKGATTSVTVTDATGIIAAEDMWFVGNHGIAQLNDGNAHNISAVVGNDLTVDFNSSGFSGTYTSGGEARVVGVHGDYIQGSFTGATLGDVDDLEVTGNLIERGEGTDGLNTDKQVIFLTDNTVDMRRAKINANMFAGFGTAFHGIDLENPVDCQIKQNTILADLAVAGATEVPGAMTITLYSGSGNTVVNNVINNIVEASGSTGNIIESNILLARTEAAYEAVLVDPMGSGDLEDDFAVLSGTIGAAGTGRVDYVAQTTSIPPWLSSATGLEDTPGVVDVTVWTDSGGGTVYAVGTASATPPSKAQVKAGQDHTGAAALDADSTTPTVPGLQALVLSLTGGTRYVHWMHEIGALQSEVETSASFTVTSALALEVLTLLSSDANVASPGPRTFSAADLGTAHADRLIVLPIFDTTTISGITVNGVAAVLVRAAGIVNFNLYQAEVPTGATGDVVVTYASGTSARCRIQPYAIYPSNKTAVDHDTALATLTTDAVLSNLQVSDGGYVILTGGQATALGTFTATWSGSDAVTEDQDIQVETVSSWIAGHILTTISDSTLDMTLAASVSGTKHIVAASWGPPA